MPSRSNLKNNHDANFASRSGDAYDDEKFMEQLGAPIVTKFEEWNSPVEQEFFTREHMRGLAALRREIFSPCDPEVVKEWEEAHAASLAKPYGWFASTVMEFMMDDKPHHMSDFYKLFPDMPHDNVRSVVNNLVPSKLERVAPATYLRRI